jgi:hypothetical protein
MTGATVDYLDDFLAPASPQTATIARFRYTSGVVVFARRKDGPPDEPRDERGRWTDADGSGKPVVSDAIRARVGNFRRAIQFDHWNVQEMAGTAPWQRPKQDFVNGQVPGFVYRSDFSSVASNRNDHIAVSDQFFTGDQAGRRGTVYHEVGHSATDSLIADGSWEGLLAPFKADSSRYLVGWSGSSRPEEILAETYGTLMSAPGNLVGLNEAEQRLVGAVRDRAAADRGPCRALLRGWECDEVAAQFGDHPGASGTQAAWRSPLATKQRSGRVARLKPEGGPAVIIDPYDQGPPALPLRRAPGPLAWRALLHERAGRPCPPGAPRQGPPQDLRAERVPGHRRVLGPLDELPQGVNALGQGIAEPRGGPWIQPEKSDDSTS